MNKQDRKKYPKPTILEWIVVGVALYWAILLLIPGDTFSSAGYTALERVAKEEVWAVIIAIIGLTQFFGVTNRGNFFRRTSHLLASGFWSTVATMFVMSNPLSTGGVYYILSLACAYLYRKEWNDK